MANIWKPVFSVWAGGTAELLRFKDSRVRVARTCSGLLNDPAKLRHSSQVSLAAGRMGILTDVRMLDIFVGFPNNATAQVTSREALLRTPAGIFAVRLNWPTFKSQFEIETG
jgi:hypothetical protein